jgi:LuxR family maltose regulon positive regulatory protein
MNISNVRISVPKAAHGEIIRRELLSAVLDDQKKLVYVHAGAGYGKTTLLSQAANLLENSVWLTLDCENDVFAFLGILCKALRHAFPDYIFNVSEYLPFEGKKNFTTILANALLNSIENLERDITIIIEDLHTIEDGQIKNLIACIMKYKPSNIRLYLSSREAPWQELISLRIRGHILEVTQKELAFTREESVQILGFDDEYIYKMTEGWPLAIGSFKVLLKNGVSLSELPSRGNEALYSYLFYECLSRLSSETVEFLKSSACFEDLDAQMLNAVLGIKNAEALLRSLVARNIFIIRTDEGHYRYHSLFREYLAGYSEDSKRLLLQQKAAVFYFDKKEYSKSAEYAMRLESKDLLKKIILTGYRDSIKNGSFNELREWFYALGKEISDPSRELLVAKGAFLSSIGNFNEAKKCLDKAIPLLGAGDRELYIEAMTHKARVLRNFVSFEESNKLLDELIPELNNLDFETVYTVLIEKIYNLCYNTQIREAYDLVRQMMEICSGAGNLKVKAWYERYLCAVHFYAGRMKDSVYYYEKSLEIPEDELKYLNAHNIGIFAAKAYQMLGERNKAVSIITAELQNLRNTGRYEELWSGCLLAAEIHYQNTFIDRMNGGSQTYETTVKYFNLADEYAPLYRNTDFQTHWAKIQRLTNCLMFSNDPKDIVIHEIFEDLEHANDYLKTIILGRLFSYFAALSDFPNAVRCAQMSIDIGEKFGIMLIPTLAYGILARAAIAQRDQEKAAALTKRFLLLCHENGVYEYFRVRKAYDPVLEFALINGIEPDIVREIMEFAGYKFKKAYITTLGGFFVYPYNGRHDPVKMRTKKERELLAFLLDAGSRGATKEQIYDALWYESDSDDVKKLIGVNLAQIKKDLACLGITDPIINHEKHYSICRDEIVVDTDLFEEAVQKFRDQGCNEALQELLSLYRGDYLAEFEAQWAAGNRIKYQELYRSALKCGGNPGNMPDVFWKPGL